MQLSVTGPAGRRAHGQSTWRRHSCRGTDTNLTSCIPWSMKANRFVQSWHHAEELLPALHCTCGLVVSGVWISHELTCEQILKADNSCSVLSELFLLLFNSAASWHNGADTRLLKQIATRRFSRRATFAVSSRSCFSYSSISLPGTMELAGAGRPGLNRMHWPSRECG